MSDPTPQENRASAEFARNAVAQEFDYRRDQIWRIFSSAANLLVAIAGTVVALASQDSFTLATAHRGLLTFVIVTITGHASAWIFIQSGFKQNVEAVLETYDEELSIAHQLPGAKKPASEGLLQLSLWLLFGVAMLTVWGVPQ